MGPSGRQQPVLACIRQGCAKIEAGKMELHLATFELRAAVEAVAATVVPLIEKNGNRPTLEVADGLGAIRSDLTRARQVLLNLLSNASKFTRRGVITVRAPREGDAVVQVVEDTGIGMIPEQFGRGWRCRGHGVGDRR